MITFKICKIFITYERKKWPEFMLIHMENLTLDRPTSKNAPSWAIADQEIISKIVDFGKDGL